MRTPVTVGVVCGAAAGESPLASAFSQLPQASLRWICRDLPPLNAFLGDGTSWTSSVEDLLRDEGLDAIAFESTALAGGARALAAVEADKHVLVYGSLAGSSGEADDLLRAAARLERRLVAHSPALLRPAARKLQSLIEHGTLGEIFYVHARRYGLRRETPDLLWGLGAETIALVLGLLGDEPVDVSAHGESYLGPDGIDVAFAELRFATGITAHVHLSQLEGVAVDSLSIVGSELTAVLDARQPDHELALYASGEPRHTFYELPFEPGAKLALHLPADDSLQVACARFVTAIRSQGGFQSPREAATAIGVLEAIARSCERHGSSEPVAALPAQLAENVTLLHGRR